MLTRCEGGDKERTTAAETESNRRIKEQRRFCREEETKQEESCWISSSCRWMMMVSFALSIIVSFQSQSRSFWSILLNKHKIPYAWKWSDQFLFFACTTYWVGYWIYAAKHAFFLSNYFPPLWTPDILLNNWYHGTALDFYISVTWFIHTGY